MKTVRILIYDGHRNAVERSIQYRNIKGETRFANDLVMHEHIVPDTHVVVEIDRSDLKLVKTAMFHLQQAGLDLEPCYAALTRVSNGAYGGDVRV